MNQVNFTASALGRAVPTVEAASTTGPECSACLGERLNNLNDRLISMRGDLHTAYCRLYGPLPEGDQGNKQLASAPTGAFGMLNNISDRMDELARLANILAAAL